MRHAIHGVRFHDQAEVPDETGYWGTPAPSVEMPVPAWVGAPRIEEQSGDNGRPVSCVAVVPASTPVDPSSLVEVLSHPVHDGLYRISSLSGGRWVRRIGLERYRRPDGTYGEMDSHGG